MRDRLLGRNHLNGRKPPPAVTWRVGRRNIMYPQNYVTDVVTRRSDTSRARDAARPARFAPTVDCEGPKPMR